MRDQTTCAYSCPRCGARTHMNLRDHDGGMWMHVKCPMCGCKFDVTTQVQPKYLDVDKQARRSVAGMTDTGRLRLADVLSKVDE